VDDLKETLDKSYVLLSGEKQQVVMLGQPDEILYEGEDKAPFRYWQPIVLD